VARQYWLPPPRPFSEPAPTRLAFETCTDGSPAVFVPQPDEPTVWLCNWPNAKPPTDVAADGVIAPEDAVVDPTNAQPTARLTANDRRHLRLTSMPTSTNPDGDATQRHGG
jgi:hypothetical protein